ncbi:MAG: multicopper oxidase domain-containing protein [Actinobacteria bacterium]|nr:multicopper oxidase domain-containing protein [Actinomycetota bacterium]
MPKRGRGLVALGAIALAFLWNLPSNAGLYRAMDPPSQICDEPTESMSLFVENLPHGRIGYGLTPETASVPGPTITMTEGDCLSVTLVNDADDRVGMHAHGVEYTPQSDGTPLNASCVAPGRSRTFVFQATAPTTRSDGTIDPGTAGYWHYHDHCMGTTHGTAGLRAGVYGALIVRRAGDLVPDRPPFVVVMNNISINNRVAPNTPVFKANQGERVEFVVIAHGDLFHTFHLHGHRWVDNRTGYTDDLEESDRLVDTRTLGPADSFGFQVIAGEGVGPGAWMFHCHVQGHSDEGMVGIFYVRNPDGTTTAQQRAALNRWRNEHVGGEHHHP